MSAESLPAVVADLGEAVVVSLAGPDARRFANGMLTNRVDAVGVIGVQRHASCDARGRMQGLLDLLALDADRLLLVLEGRSSADFLAHYARFLLMDDATLEDASGGRRHLTVQGQGAEQRLRAAGLDVPQFVSETDGVVVYRRARAGLSGFDVISSDAGVLGATQNAVFEALRVAAGDVRWPDDMSDKQMVHEMGLRDAVLSFKKGCYVGQETINRLEVRGGVKQRLVGVRLPRAVQPGSEILVEAKTVGTLRSVAEHPEYGWLGLAVVRMPHDMAGTALQIDGIQGTTTDLPVQ